jgi:hypothetical protein
MQKTSQIVSCMYDCMLYYIMCAIFFLYHDYSMCAGLVGAIMATPADVIKTRIMNQPTDERGR